MSALVAMQQPELINGVVFSAPSILPPVGFILVCALDYVDSHSDHVCLSSVVLLV